MVKKAKTPSKGKVSSKDKNAIKTTVILLCFFALCAGIFLFLNRDKKGVNPPVTVSKKTQVPLPKKPTVSPVKKVTVPAPQKPVVVGIPKGKGKIAFILDDWGYRISNCQYLKTINAPLAIAVLPNLKHTNDIMKCASLYDKDIMLHLPMEPYHNPDHYPDSYLLTTAMPKAKVVKLLDEMLSKMPMIIGVNNHMGSKATEDKALMKTIYERIRRKGLFFVDSMTAPHHSVCGSLADEMKIPFAMRDVFLDNVNTKSAIEKQIVELAQKASRKGYAIAIGHDRALTLEVIAESIPILRKQGFEIVHVRELLRNKPQ